MILDQKHCFFPLKFADLRFADRDSKDIFGFAICGLILANVRISICGLAHLINLLIGDSVFAICGLIKIFACPPGKYSSPLDIRKYIIMPDRKEQPLPCETMPAHELVAARYIRV